MAKLAALLAALLLAAHLASAFCATITIDESIRRPSREQIQQRDLSHCTRYLRKQQQQQQEGYDGELSNCKRQRNECCNELRMIRDEQYRCEGLQMEMQREMQQGRMRAQDMRQMMRTAQRLPNACGMRPSQCRFEVPSY